MARWKVVIAAEVLLSGKKGEPVQPLEKGQGSNARKAREGGCRIIRVKAKGNPQKTTVSEGKLAKL